MAGAKRDLCERTFKFAGRIVRLCRHLDERPGVARTLGEKTGTVPSAASLRAETGLSPLFAASCKEARETNYWLRLLASTEIVDGPDLHDLLEESDQLIRILTSIIKKTKENAQ